MKSFTADLDILPTLPDVGFGFGFNLRNSMCSAFFLILSLFEFMCVFVREGEIGEKTLQRGLQHLAHLCLIIGI